MTTHFQGRFEVEFKYRLTDSAAFVHTLTALSPEVMVADNHEQDCYFDTADGALAREEKSLIIRTMAPSGIRLWIVKGPGPDRCEAVNITDADKAASMVRTLGYQPVLTIDKRRSIYFLGAFHVTVDHLAGVGDFAELAIMTDDETALPAYRAQLLALASRLGLAPEMRETRSYRTLCEQRAPPLTSGNKRNLPMIDKLAWLTFKEGQLLCARSHGKDIYYIPGGKREPGESDEAALVREIEEELAVTLKPDTLAFACEFSAQADGKPQGVNVNLRCYTGDADGTPVASAEIAELRWLDSRHLAEVSPVSRLLFQWLAAQGLIH